jgi:hypothetical protein
MHIKFKWDEAKRLRNLEKHGVDFAEVAEFEWDEATHAVDEWADYGETRIVSMMPHRGRLHLCCWTPRGEAVRLITVRKANDREARIYAQARRQP